VKKAQQLGNFDKKETNSLLSSETKKGESEKLLNLSEFLAPTVELTSRRRNQVGKKGNYVV
jgi:hypothetical protein